MWLKQKRRVRVAGLGVGLALLLSGYSGYQGHAAPAADQEFSLRPGEIAIEGRIASVDTEHQSLVLDATSFTLPNGNTKELTTAKSKPIQCAGQTQLHGRGAPQQKLTLADLTNLETGIFAIAIGKDAGSGAALTAREIAIWDRVDQGVYRFGNPATAVASPTGVNSSPRQETKPPPPQDEKPVDWQARARKWAAEHPVPFDLLQPPAPGEWVDPAPFIVDADHVKVTGDSNNHTIQLVTDAATPSIMVQHRVQLTPAWRSVSVVGQVQTHLTPITPPPAKSGAWITGSFEDANHQELQPIPGSQKLRGEHPEEQLAYHRVVPPGAVYLKVTLISQGEIGSATFNHVSVWPNIKISNGTPPLSDQDALPLTNGTLRVDFEKFDDQGEPVNWRLSASKLIHISEEADNHFLRLQNDRLARDNRGGVALISEINQVRLDPAWKRLKLQARLRGTALRPGVSWHNDARLVAAFRDATFHVVGFPTSFIVPSDTTDWQDESVELSIPPTATILSLTPQMINCIGAVDFDDIQVTAREPLPPQPLGRGFPAGTFEQVDDQGQPLGWLIENPRDAQVVVERGNHFLRLTRHDGSDVQVEGAFQLNPAWKKISIRARLRAHDLATPFGKSGAGLSCDFMDASGSPIAAAPMLTITRDGDWQEFVMATDLPKGAVSIILRPQIVETKGKIDFDDIRITGA